MKIFIPAYKDQNPYFDQIIPYSKHDYVFDNFSCYKKQYEIVNVHWPESIFGWKEPTERDLDMLEKDIQQWKKNSKLVYTRHDASRHEGMTPAFHKLFRIIEENAHAFIHLGKVSLKQMKKKFPQASHCILYHPLYENSFQPIEKTIARKKLKIRSDALVVIAPGRIRSKEEREMTLNGFNSLPVKNKVLLSNNMLPFRYNFEFPGRVKLKKLLDVNKSLSRIKESRYKPPKYLFHYGFSNSKDLALMMSAADIVFIPRINILNSGNIFLGLTFKKIIVGPAVGNLEEQLNKFGFPLFDPQSPISIKRTLVKGAEMVKNESFEINKNFLEDYKPSHISSQIDLFFKNLV